jgi:pimeloyl-ACP methyl ester carboxylesterase
LPARGALAGRSGRRRGGAGYRAAGAPHPGRALRLPGLLSLWPEDDQRVLADPESEAMLVEDIVLIIKGRCRAPIDDARLFGRDWGFRLADVKVPVRWWRGDPDHLMPLAVAEAAVSRPPDAELILRPGESHLGGFAKADEVLEFVRELL